MRRPTWRFGHVAADKHCILSLRRQKLGCRETGDDLSPKEVMMDMDMDTDTGFTIAAKESTDDNGNCAEQATDEEPSPGNFQDEDDDHDDKNDETVKDLQDVYERTDENGKGVTDRDEWAFTETKRTFDDLTDKQYAMVVDLALDEAHSSTLSKKVESVMEKDYDVREGVNQQAGVGAKPMPIAANLDLSTYHARQAMNQRGNFTEAEQIYVRCTEYNPVDGRAWLGLARLYQKRGSMAKAEKAYKDGLYYNPRNPYLLQSWAVMLEKSGRIPQAMKLLRSSVQSNPKHSASWVALGHIHKRGGRIDEARFCFKSAIDGDSRSYVALQALGVLESDTGNLNEARKLFKKAVTLSRNSVHTLQAWATLERRTGNLEAAQKLLGRALKEWPKSTHARVSLAEIHELRGDVDKARRTFELGAAFAERCGDAGFFQSWALMESRQGRVCSETDAESGDRSSHGAKHGSDGSGGNGRGGSADEAQGVLTGNGDVVEGKVRVRDHVPGKHLRRTPRHEESLSPGLAGKVRTLFRRAIKVNKYHSASWIAWAKFEQRSGNPEVARKLLTEGISNFPHSKNIAWFHTALGNLAWQRADLTTARACYGRALDSTPPQKSLNILLEYAKMEERLGGRQGFEARGLYERAISRFPNEDRAWSAYVDFERRRERAPGTPTDKRFGSTGDDEGSFRSDDNGADPTCGAKYNPGGRVGALLARRKAQTNLKTSPLLLGNTEWEAPNESNRI